MARTQRRLEGVELSAGDGLGEVDELHPKAQVRLVGPNLSRAWFQVIVAIAGGRSPLTGERRFDDGLADELEDLCLTHERCLDVELGELELSIRT